MPPKFTMDNPLGGGLAAQHGFGPGLPRRNRATDTEHERTAVGPNLADEMGMQLGSTKETGNKELDNFHGQMNEVLLDDVMQMAVKDKMKVECDKALAAARGEDARWDSAAVVVSGEGGYVGESCFGKKMLVVRLRMFFSIHDNSERLNEHCVVVLVNDICRRFVPFF